MPLVFGKAWVPEYRWISTWTPLLCKAPTAGTMTCRVSSFCASQSYRCTIFLPIAVACLAIAGLTAIPGLDSDSDFLDRFCALVMPTFRNHDLSKFMRRFYCRSFARASIQSLKAPFDGYSWIQGVSKKIHPSRNVGKVMKGILEGSIHLCDSSSRPSLVASQSIICLEIIW
jgi:hypothetical protein